MKKINKSALTAIAVVSVVIILSTGIAAAQQASVRKAPSPLFKERTKAALGLAAPELGCGSSPESQLVKINESRDGFFATCPCLCTIHPECTTRAACTSCHVCPLQVDSGVGDVVNSFQ